MIKPLKILSIDGGGIKGLYSATVLSRLEQKFSCSLSDKFDMICGTSTGGLIALAISLGIPCETVCSLYKEKGALIFPPQNSFARKIESLVFGNGKFGTRQILGRGKYDSLELKKALAELFGDRTLSESKNLLCIPTYSITDGRPWVFKFDHTNLSRDNKAKYVDVALATSAAPTYLPIHEIPDYDNKQFIDGGVWANNPAMVGWIEAKKFFVGPSKEYDGIEMLSVSSLSKAFGKPVGWKRNRGFRGWKADLFTSMMSGQSQSTEYMMKTLSELPHTAFNYFRIPSDIVSSDQEVLVDLDVTNSEALHLLSGKGNDVADIVEKKTELIHFFK